jgi:hypothetical protein
MAFEEERLDAVTGQLESRSEANGAAADDENGD